MTQGQIFFESTGIALIMLGTLFTLFNWIFFFMDLKLKREGANRHISMVGAVGLCLPLGFLFFDTLRPHAFWIWLLDPASSLVFGPSHSLIQFIQSRRQK